MRSPAPKKRGRSDIPVWAVRNADNFEFFLEEVDAVIWQPIGLSALGGSELAIALNDAGQFVLLLVDGDEHRYQTGKLGSSQRIQLIGQEVFYDRVGRSRLRCEAVPRSICISGKEAKITSSSSEP